MNVVVEITETSVHTFHIPDVTSLEEAETIAQEAFEEGEVGDSVEVLDLELDSYEEGEA